MTARQLSVLRSHDDREIPVAGEYVINPAHTSVEFIGRHLMITKVRGCFPTVSGVITVAEEPERSHVEVDIEMASLDTGDPRRDGHLRSPHCFDAEKYPKITFRSASVEAGPSGIWLVTGDLTVGDVTRPVTLEVSFDGASALPGGGERIGFSAATEVDRKDWGLTWNVTLETGGSWSASGSVSSSTSRQLQLCRSPVRRGERRERPRDDRRQSAPSVEPYDGK